MRILRAVALCVCAAGCSALHGSSIATPDVPEAEPDVTVKKDDAPDPGDLAAPVDEPAPVASTDAPAIAPPPPDDGPRCDVVPSLAGCATAAELGDGAALRDLDPFGGAAAACGPVVRWYRVAVPPGLRLRARVSNEVLANLPRLSLHASCDDGAALEPDDRGDPPRERYLRWDNRGGLSRVVYLGVAGGSARFDLRVDVIPVPPEARCATAPRVGPDATTLDVPLQDSGDALDQCGVTLPGRLYRVRVPAGHRITASMARGIPGVSLRLLNGCPATACLASRDGARNLPLRLDWTNRGEGDAEVLLDVSASSVPAAARAMVAVQVHPPATNARCESATPLPDGRSVSGDTAAAEAVAPGCGGGDAPALYYHVAVPGDHRVIVSAVSARARLLDGCATLRCLGGTARGETWWTNNSPTTRDVIVAVSSESASEVGSCSVSALVVPISAAGRCTTPEELSLFSEHRSFAEDARVAPLVCGAGASPAIYYRVSLMAGERIRAWATDEQARALPLAILDGCEGPCRYRVSGPRGELAWANMGASPRTMLLAVEAGAWASSRRVELRTSRTTAVQGSLCAMPLEGSRGFIRDLDPVWYEGQTVDRCVGDGSVAPAVFHRIMVAPGATLTVTLTVGAEVDRVALRAFRDCASLSVCAARGVVTGPTRVALTWTNDAATPQALIVASNYDPLRVIRRYSLEF